MNTLVPDARLSSRTHAAEVLLVSIALLRLLEIPWYGLLACLLLLIGLTMFGRVINVRLFDGEPNLGTSFVVGCGTFVLLGQLLLLVGVRYPIAHWVSFALVVVSAVTIWKLSRPPIVASRVTLSGQAHTALAIGLAALSIYHVWLVPFAAMVAVRSLLRGRATTPVARLLFALSLVLGWISSFELRPDRWWYYYQGNDSQYFEAIGWSIARWGIFEHPGYVGFSIANYHWFTYAFFGSLSEIASFGPWIALVRFGPLLIAVLLASLFVTHTWTPIQWFAALIAVIASGITRADSMAFSLIVALVVIDLVNRSTTARLRMSHYLLFILLSATVMLAKVSTAAIIFSVLLLLLVLQRRRKEASSFPIVLCFTASFGAIYLLLLRNNDSALLTEEFDLNLAESLRELQDLLESDVALNYLLWLMFIPLVIVGRRSWRSIESLELAVVVVASTAFVGHVLVAGKNSRYFALAGIAMVTFITLRRLGQGTARRTTRVSGVYRTSLGALIVFGLVAGYVSADVLRRARTALDLDGSVEIWLRDTLIAGGLPLALCALILLSMANRRLRITTLIGMILVVSVVVGQRAEYYRQTLRLGPGVYTSSNVANAVFGTSEIVSLGNWIRSNTSVETILASNQFCDVGETRYVPRYNIDGEFWLQKVVAPTSECTWRIPYFLMPVYTQRRFLAQGSVFQLGTAKVDSDQLRRLVASIAFANRPSSTNFQYLKSRGVSGFIVNLSLTKVRDWSDFAVERYRSGNFLYLQLK